VEQEADAEIIDGVQEEAGTTLNVVVTKPHVVA
jgi:hypothetical protein